VATIDSLGKNDPRFKVLLQAAAEECLTNGGHEEDLEEYAGKYLSRKMELELKRHRIVYGQCSRDNSPRRHALNIALLSAETASWEVFLRAHLDIMNDRFRRNSDASYAQAKRQTYIRELEVLDINVTDLLLGICLMAENTGQNHYYGDIFRIGRALSETEHSQEVENRMLGMIRDTTLDDFNRLRMFYLFRNYNYYLNNKTQQHFNNAKLADACKTFPPYMTVTLKEIEGEEEN
jgi:hypothetical protein